MTTAAINPVMKTSSATGRVAWAPASLRNRQIFSRRILEGEIFRVRVKAGHLWSTFEGSADDHLLMDGDLMRFHGPGLMVLEGIEQGAAFEIAQEPVFSSAVP